MIRLDMMWSDAYDNILYFIYNTVVWYDTVWYDWYSICYLWHDLWNGIE